MQALDMKIGKILKIKLLLKKQNDYVQSVLINA
jgi:hypothetical protein